MRQDDRATYVELSEDEWKVINAIKAETIDNLTVTIVTQYAERCSAAGISEEVFVSTLVLSMLVNMVRTLATLKGVPDVVVEQNHLLFQRMAVALQDCADEAINEFIRVSTGEN